jgi:hypothetical protein
MYTAITKLPTSGRRIVVDIIYKFHSFTMRSDFICVTWRGTFSHTMFADRGTSTCDAEINCQVHTLTATVPDLTLIRRLDKQLE